MYIIGDKPLTFQESKIRRNELNRIKRLNNPIKKNDYKPPIMPKLKNQLNPFGETIDFNLGKNI